MNLLAFHPLPFSSSEEVCNYCLCPLRALHHNVDRTKGLRRSNELFVSWADSHMGKPIALCYHTSLSWLTWLLRTAYLQYGSCLYSIVRYRTNVWKRTLGYSHNPSSLITGVRYLTTLPSLQQHGEEICWSRGRYSSDIYEGGGTPVSLSWLVCQPTDLV